MRDQRLTKLPTPTLERPPPAQNTPAQPQPSTRRGNKNGNGHQQIKTKAPWLSIEDQVLADFGNASPRGDVELPKGRGAVYRISTGPRPEQT